MLNNTQTYSDMWQNCLDRIKAQTSEEEFVKWFQPIVPLEFDGTNLRLRVPNESYVHQIEKNYIPFLRPIISQLYGQQTRLHYAVPRSAAQAVPVTADADTTAISRFNTQTNTANIKNPFVIPGLKKIIIDPQLNPGLTFATFIEGECNRLARSAGMSVAVNPGNNPFNPLYIYGDSGLGKTHIVQAIGHEVRQRHPELQVLYVSMNKFQAQFQTAYKNGEIPDFIHFYQMIDVLIIDDIQELTGKTGTQNAFFNIFNHLQLAGKQLILTSDKPPVELKDIEQRLLTRFKWGLSAQLNTPDYDTKLKIIRVKAQKFGAQISDDVVAYLADNISANVREIEGALSSLVANASFLGRKITTSLAKEILKVYVQLYQKEITIDQQGFDYAITLGEKEVSVANFSAFGTRYFDVKVKTNVDFAVEVPTSAESWLKYDSYKVELDRGIRPREVTVRFNWSINSQPNERIADVVFKPKREVELARQDNLLVTQGAAEPIEENTRSGDSIALLAIARTLGTNSSWENGERMDNWDDVTLWEEGMTGYTPEKNGRVKYARFFMFDTKEELPFEVQYLTAADELIVYSNVNAFLKDLTTGEYITKLTQLKRLTIAAYGLVSLDKNFTALKNLEFST